MARKPVEDELAEEDEILEEGEEGQDADGQVEEEGEGEGEGETEDQPFLYSVTSQTPWWIVSILLHALVVTLAGLLTLTIELPEGEPPPVMTTEFAKPQDVITEAEKPKPESQLSALASKHDTPPTDKTSKEESNIVVPPEILAKAELGDHFETINLDKEDTHSAFGNPDAHMFHSEKGSDDAAGGGGNSGASLEDLIGVGGASSPGSGGGWGGGKGTGTGVDEGGGHGSFGLRNGGGRKLMVKKHGGSKQTENAVDSALHWLAYHQEADGHWDAKKYSSQPKTDTAVTGLALLAFLGAGHSEKVGEYKDHVKKAVEWLKSKQDPSGLIWDTTDDGARHRAKGYPGAIATLALAEAAGMANVAETRAAAQKAIDYCTEMHQQGDGSDKLGFRYSPKEAGDLSVTGWFTMAMKSAKVAGLHVNPAAFDGAIKFLDSVEHKEPGGDAAYGPASTYGYTPGEPHAGTAHRLTAIGNLCRHFLGFKKEELQNSVEGFVKRGGIPDWGAAGEKVDMYYWYYGTLCVFQQGGDLWKRWNEGMKKSLMDNQSKQGDDAGSWNPVGEFSQEWGRVGQTALGALCLEVYYRYMQLQPDAK